MGTEIKPVSGMDRRLCSSGNRGALVLTIGLLILLLIWDFSGLDLAVSRNLADTSGFWLRQHWLFSKVLHDSLRLLSVLIAALLLLNVWRPLIRGIRFWRRIDWFVTCLSVAFFIAALKRFSATSCPWHLAEFGGQARYVSHWVVTLNDGGPGHCFPSGHAVSEFAFLAGWLVLRDHRPRLARLWLVSVLMAGLLAGTAQVVRGAHYVSHVLWSAWLCWVFTLMTLFALSRVRRHFDS